MMMRAYHRWFGLASALFMIVIAVTGIALHLDLWVTGEPPPGADLQRRGGPVTVPARSRVEAAVGEALDRAHAETPDLEVRQVQILFTPDGMRVSAGGAGPYAERIDYDPTARTIRRVPAKSVARRLFLQDIHAGYIAGQGGRVLSFLAGVSLLLLGVSGLYIYSDLYFRRRKAGKKAPFWRK